MAGVEGAARGGRQPEEAETPNRVAEEGAQAGQDESRRVERCRIGQPEEGCKVLAGSQGCRPSHPECQVTLGGPHDHFADHCTYTCTRTCCRAYAQSRTYPDLSASTRQCRSAVPATAQRVPLRRPADILPAEALPLSARDHAADGQRAAARARIVRAAARICPLELVQCVLCAFRPCQN